MTGWHHRCNGHELMQTLGDGEGQDCLLQSMGSQRVQHNWVTEQQPFPFGNHHKFVFYVRESVSVL